MRTLKITEGEVAPLKVASLPSRPNAPTAMGGRGYTATQMKEAFDRLPLLLVERFNSLIEDIEGEDGIRVAIPTGIREEHTLADMLEDIVTGEACNYFTVSGESLASCLARLRLELDIVKRDMGNAFSGSADFMLDCGSPAELAEMTGGGALV